ncbi:MAG TPA: transglutaminase family protein [Polyangiaceae bacterium]|jgi:transglutaminase-like putative cysteine protease
MKTLSVRHTTRYEYESPVVHAHHAAHLAPRVLQFQRVSGHTLSATPEPAALHEQHDYFGNRMHLIEILREHDQLEVTAQTYIGLEERDTPEGLAARVTWEDAVERLAADRGLVEVSEFSFDSPLVRAHSLLGAYARDTFQPRRALLDAVLELNQRIHGEFVYDPRATDVSTPLAQVLRDRRGVCQDFAHVAVGSLRSLGLAARYVSGYLETQPPPGVARLVGADASHAWASVYIPGFGWFDFDPTNAVLAGLGHVTIGWGRDFSDVSPLKGVVHGGGQHRVTVAVDVEALE